jgi:hypothetical protein
MAGDLVALLQMETANLPADGHGRMLTITSLGDAARGEPAADPGPAP